MIGIYKIQNKENGKIYIGQSNNCERRIKEHCYPNRYLCNLPIDIAIHKYGKEQFTFEIIEECPLEKLNERETYWILFYESHTEKGYNCNVGGDNGQIGEGNGNAKVTEEDVIKIRQAYNAHKRKKETYQLVENKITFNSFEDIWEGQTWQHIMPEVYTEENKKYYSTGAGCINTNQYSDEEVMEFRRQYVTKTAHEIYDTLEEIKLTYPSFQKMLNGQTYKHLPYYSKKLKGWYDQNNPAPKVSENRGKHATRSNRLSDEEVTKYRQLYIDKTARDIYEEFNLQNIMTFDSFQKILRGATYKHLPYYSKTKQEWINQ